MQGILSFPNDFGISNDSKLTQLNDLENLKKIVGLEYVSDFITIEEHDELINCINNEKWLDDLKRRVQHYGYKYDYRTRYVDYSMKIGNLPNWIISVAKKIQTSDFMDELPDQMIVNEYLPGQGISAHIDCEPCFGDTVISLSLGSTCVMKFSDKYSSEKIEVFLEPRSIVILKKDARYNWTHEIVPKKKDIFKNIPFQRSTRISLTFRNIKLI
jgi:alkylated DNA repair dioxygenase AlkB